MTYLVYWPRYGVMKAGRAWKMTRIRGLVAAGAEVLVLVRDTPSSWERGGLEALRGRFDQRFESAIDASRLLPHVGSGWTECFCVLYDELRQAIDIFIEGPPDMPMTKRRFVTPEEMTDEDLGELTASTRFLAVVLRMWATTRVGRA